MSARRLSDPKRFTVRTEGNGYLPTHRTPLAHINKDRLTGGAGASRLHTWTTPFVVSIPGIPGRRKVRLPIPPALAAVLQARLSRPRALIAAVALALILLLNVTVIWRRLNSSHKDGMGWGEAVTNAVTKSDTCVFSLDQLRRIYEWEIWSGNYPTRRRIPAAIGIPHSLFNPAVPPIQQPPTPTVDKKLPFATPPYLIDGFDNATIGFGPKRTFIAPEARPPNVAYPPRPVPGSVADLDKIMQYCDYGTDQYVRDCLEVLRTGAGLDNGNRVRRGNLEPWRYIFTENATDSTPPDIGLGNSARPTWLEDTLSPKSALRRTGSEALDLLARPPMPARGPGGTACDPERPRIFHVYWAGPFTDKPYLTLMSYLYTQPLGLHAKTTDPASDPASTPCRPQFWVWINPGVQASVPNTHAKADMFDTLAANPWSAPFLHQRFHDVIKFKLWNTTERLDAFEELAGWRRHPVLGKLSVETDTALKLEEASELLDKFSKVEAAAASKSAAAAQNTGGATAAAKILQVAAAAVAGASDRPLGEQEKDAAAAMVQLKKADEAQVVMSDLARFLVTHAFGGIYLDVDHVLLRDWEELWGWRGAFATRWSVHEWYNTAILRMHANSALGSFLLKTAMTSKSEIPFHPFTITQYIDDARLGPLLFRIPDAVFDSDFLNMEGRQRDRPPYPAYSPESKFEEFFVAPARSGGEAQAATFDAFYRGAFAYHWHNNWEKPVDLGRNFPELGPLFTKGERLALERDRARHTTSVRSSGSAVRSKPTRGSGSLLAKEHALDEAEGTEQRVALVPGAPADEPEPVFIDDERDLSWSAMLKRTFEAYVRGERPNMYGEWFVWE